MSILKFRSFLTDDQIEHSVARRLVTVATFVWSCVALALNCAMDPTTRYTPRRNFASVMKIGFFLVPVVKVMYPLMQRWATPFATFCLALPLFLTVGRFVFIFKGNVLENVNVRICLFLRNKQDSVDVKTFFGLHRFLLEKKDSVDVKT